MASHRRVILGGRGATLVAKDVFDIAARDSHVELDAAATDKLQRASDPLLKAAKQATPSAPAVPSTDSAASHPEILRREQMRAALAVQALQLLGTAGIAASLRPSVPQFLADLLNAGGDLALPASKTDAPVVQAVQDALLGQGSAATWNEHGTASLSSLDDAFKAAVVPAASGKAAEATTGLNSPSLYEHEAPAFQTSTAASVGVAAVAVHAASSLVAVADAVAAFSCEALRANVAEMLDADTTEGSHKAQAEVAGDMRALLAGSKCVNPRKDAANLLAVRGIPQCHGPLREAVKTAASAVRVELNCGGESGAAGGAEGGGKGKSGAAAGTRLHVPSVLVAGHVASLLRALCPLGACSVRRISAMVAALSSLQPPPAAAAPDAVPADAAVRAADGGAAPTAPEHAGGAAGEVAYALVTAQETVDAAKVTAGDVAQAVAAADPLGAEEEGAAGAAGGTAAGRGRERGARDDGVPALMAARAALATVEALRMVLALEAVAALRLLRAREAALAARTGGGKAPKKEDAKAADGAAEGRKVGKEKEGGKDKKGKGGGGGELALGRGTAVLAAFLDGIVGTAQDKAGGGGSAAGADAGVVAVVGAVERVAVALDPRGDEVAQLEGALRGAIESNESRRAPKIAKVGRGTDSSSPPKRQPHSPTPFPPSLSLGCCPPLPVAHCPVLSAAVGSALFLFSDPAPHHLPLHFPLPAPPLSPHPLPPRAIPQGTRDFLPDQMAIRERAFAIIAAVFKRHGAVALDTPVFELRETLMGKYGEDSKLIYDLADQGGEILSLRYDLTVPFARYLAMHSVGNIKRYHVARVYRRDNPQMNRGRYREFYQCDFDIAGQYAPMVPDAEVVKVLTELLDELAIGDYEIKLNHRGLLDGMLAICGVPGSKFRAICSAVDKLDKEPWEAVRTEMIEEKGLLPEVADRIGDFVKHKGEPHHLLATLQAPDSPFAGHADSQAALAELALLFDYLAAMGGAVRRVVFDLSLARGLDYYTGVIYEAVLKGGSTVGSIAAGGRYDNLVGMFSGKQVPAVGVSLGIERVFTIMEEQERKKNQLIRATETQVLVASIGPDLLRTRMEIASALWAEGVKAEFVLAASPNMQRQLEFANKAGIPWMVIFGSAELDKGTVKVKDLERREEEEVTRASLILYLKRKLGLVHGRVEVVDGVVGEGAAAAAAAGAAPAQ
ncbi:unnamed protein product [Closterium sp. Naga37s-1]|nr:unnamed protein product [Closterium sp. Naga37s-1]